MRGLLAEAAGSVVGTRVVLLVGSGNNGGDALWAGAMLADRGCRVDAVCLSDRVHVEGSRRPAAGRRPPPAWREGDAATVALIEAADLVVDGILGIGGAGGLQAGCRRPRRASVDAAEAIVVAVDLPSGVDADTGVVAGSRSPPT